MRLRLDFTDEDDPDIERAEYTLHWEHSSHQMLNLFTIIMRTMNFHEDTIKDVLNIDT